MYCTILKVYSKKGIKADTKYIIFAQNKISEKYFAIKERKLKDKIKRYISVELCFIFGD